MAEARDLHCYSHVLENLVNKSTPSDLAAVWSFKNWLFGDIRANVLLSRKTHDSLGAKLLTASIALRAYGNRHLGTLMRCCEAWEPVIKCFDPISLECTDFQGLSQIIAILTRESLAERHRRRKTMRWPNVGLDSVLGVPRNLCFVFTLSLTKTVILWKTKINQAEGFVARLSKHAPRVRNITNSKIHCGMFRKLLTISGGSLIETNLTNSLP